MKWHDLKVLTVYAVVVTAILFILGEKELAIAVIIIYPIYGLICCVVKNKARKKLDQELDTVSDHLREITQCHILNRNPKLNKSLVKKIKREVIDGNYQIKSMVLIKKTDIPSPEPDGGSTFYCEFDSGDKYRVTSGVYTRAREGAVLWVVTTPSTVMKVIQSEENYFNMFTY